MRLLFFIVLLAGIGNPVLRLEIENPYTLYRVIAPLGLIAVFAFQPLLFLKYIGVFAVFVVYNFVLASMYSSDYSQFFPSIVHYFYLFILLLMMSYLKLHHAMFDQQFIRFIQGFYVFLLLNLLVEFLFGSFYPNLYIDETGEKSVRAFFWNQNDLAVVLCMVGWIALALDRFRGRVRIVVVLLTVAILYFNDSKSALLSFLLISLPVFMICRVCAVKRIAPAVLVFMFGAISLAAFFTFVVVEDVNISFANDTFTVNDLLLRPILNIVKLEPSGEEWGSINNRTDAGIFVIVEYLKSYGFGLGAGGSWLVLTLPQYELGGAKSPHNALLQFTVDFGYPVLLGYAFLTYWALRRLFVHRLGEYDRLRVMAILSFPMLGLSQSGAIVTNYFFFAVVYFIWLLGRRSLFANTKSENVPKPNRLSPNNFRGVTSGFA